MLLSMDVKDVRTQEQLNELLSTGKRLGDLAKRLMIVRGLQITHGKIPEARGTRFFLCIEGRRPTRLDPVTPLLS